MDKEEQQPQTSFPVLLQTTFSASPVLRKIAAVYKIAQRKKNIQIHFAKQRHLY
jgi:hypothetical protein